MPTPKNDLFVEVTVLYLNGTLTGNSPTKTQVECDSIAAISDPFKYHTGPFRKKVVFYVHQYSGRALLCEFINKDNFDEVVDTWKDFVIDSNED